jgi:20S proteasome alpha/beta subunit
MTVCIAAIYNDNSILGASDRMVTGGYGDLTFQPPIPKIVSITNSIAVMTAGDQNIQMQVFKMVSEIVNEKIRLDPSQWIKVVEVAENYSKCFYKLRNKLAEDCVLSRYNLTLSTFISKQKEMDQQFIDMITRKIERFDVDQMSNQSVETIIIGIDDDGPHVYIVADGEISCHDKLGFASIGIGGAHANSHFMHCAYSRSASESKALLTIHQAKKKSEVSPGVGKETDMCLIGPLKGSFTMIGTLPNGVNIVGGLDTYYDKYIQAIKKLDIKTERIIKDYLNRLASATQLNQEASSSPSASVSSSTMLKAPLSVSHSKSPKLSRPLPKKIKKN